MAPSPISKTGCCDPSRGGGESAFAQPKDTRFAGSRQETARHLSPSSAGCGVAGGFPQLVSPCWLPCVRSTRGAAALRRHLGVRFWLSLELAGLQPVVQPLAPNELPSAHADVSQPRNAREPATDGVLHV